MEARTDLNTEQAVGTWQTMHKRTKTLHCFDKMHVSILFFLFNKWIL
jgi:hypothetical protein